MEIKLWCKHTAEGLDQSRADALLDIGSGIIGDTPIDTGWCRGNWQSSLNVRKETQLPIRPSIAAVAELAETVGSMKGDETFILRNNLVYATALEFGHSGQAPNGMVRKNVQRWGGVVQKAARKAK
jgi:hypothetical protein